MKNWKVQYANDWGIYYREGEEWRWRRSFSKFEDAAKYLYDEYGYSLEVFVA